MYMYMYHYTLCTVLYMYMYYTILYCINTHNILVQYIKYNDTCTCTYHISWYCTILSCIVLYNTCNTQYINYRSNGSYNLDTLIGVYMVVSYVVYI